MEISNDRIVRAVIKGTRTGKIKWIFNGSAAEADYKQLLLMFSEQTLFVKFAHEILQETPFAEDATRDEFIEMMETLRQEQLNDERLESVIMELESEVLDFRY